jgi:putative holliday junction resolvase
MVANPKYETMLALDVGERRIGVARARLDARFPQPMLTLDNPDTFIDDIAALCVAEKAGLIVIGLPRGLSGQETPQTAMVQKFGTKLEARLDIPLYWIDEAVTSEKAETVLKNRGKPYVKGDIDALAATFILEDFITERPEAAHV